MQSARLSDRKMNTSIASKVISQLKKAAGQVVSNHSAAFVYVYFVFICNCKGTKQLHFSLLCF